MTAPESAHGDLSFANTKTDATANDDSTNVKLLLAEDPMQIARLGEVEMMRDLIVQGKLQSGFKDAEDITPLHVSHAHHPFHATVLNFGAVGRYQQPLRNVQAADRFWR